MTGQDLLNWLQEQKNLDMPVYYFLPGTAVYDISTVHIGPEDSPDEHTETGCIILTAFE